LIVSISAVDRSARRRLALEDFCSILDLPASVKCDGTIERMAGFGAGYYSNGANVVRIRA
jgi:hypothetical protein